ncbi:MAG: hypothetical protein JXM71_12060 [Spirochaetales bacterium]|nr:hypothetical protein [Spirochaetales bacterium]
MRLTTRLLVLVFLSVVVPMLGLSIVLKQELSESILNEKRDKLFGLARQLDTALEGTYEGLLEAAGASHLDRPGKIAALNAALRDITDFVASGNPGVGVGYYGRDLDAVLTYGPSGQFQHTVGQSIFEGHKGYEVMATGTPMVQTGTLVRGDILNCMWPVIRDGSVIGYIWANETLDMIDDQLEPIIRRVYLIDALIVVLIYFSVTMTMKGLLDRIQAIKTGIDVLFHAPSYHIPPVSGELSLIVSTINELVDTSNVVKCYNKNILESVQNGVLAVSCSGEVTRANRAFRELFPGFEEDAIGRDYRDSVAPEIAAFVSAGLDGTGRIEPVELELGGSILEAYGNAIIDETGSRLGAVFAFRDITVIRRYEREIQEKERAAMLGEMALAVVHEVKNPMTSVKGFSQLLGRPGISEDKRGTYLKLIDDELNRVDRLLNEMLVYGGKSRLERRLQDLLVLVSDTVERNDWSAYPAKPVVVAEPGEDWRAEVDAFKIGQVLDNVLRNACEAVDAKGYGRVVVVLKASDLEVELRVVDSGVGIPRDVLSRVGNPLFSTKRRGNGFGLATSRKLVEAHGGSLVVTSIEGVYTSVSVRLPRDARNTEDSE